MLFFFFNFTDLQKDHGLVSSMNNKLYEYPTHGYPKDGQLSEIGEVSFHTILTGVNCLAWESLSLCIFGLFSLHYSVLEKLPKLMEIKDPWKQQWMKNITSLNFLTLFRPFNILNIRTVDIFRNRKKKSSFPLKKKDFLFVAETIHRRKLSSVQNIFILWGNMQSVKSPYSHTFYFYQLNNGCAIHDYLSAMFPWSIPTQNNYLPQLWQSCF